MTTKKKIESKLRAIEESIYELSHKASEALQLTAEGFNLHSKKHLKDAEKLAHEVHAGHVVLTDELLNELENHKEELLQIKKLIPIPGHLERVGDCCESIIVVTYTKIKEGTLFSDRAVSEINEIFNNTIELIKSAGDVVLTKNKLLTKHIISETENINNKADDCATMHEERLILGVCNSKSGSMFLDILDSLQNIALHLKKIAISASNS
ncbi:hypothetical protein ACFL2A_04520 [Thermodesulfobacteriota bacterium]